MQTYDIIMLVVLGIATFMGAIKGLAWQVASLASIVVSYGFAYNLRGQVATYIKAQEPWNTFLAMLLIYAGCSFAIWVFFRLISGVIDRFRMRDFDRHMGALVGFGKGVLLCMLITMFAVTLLGPRQQQAIVDSQSGAYISRLLAATNGIVWPKEIEQIVRPYLNQLEQRLDGRQPNGNLVSGRVETTQGEGGWFGFGGGRKPEAGNALPGNVLPENIGNGNWQLPLPGNPVTTPNNNSFQNGGFGDVLPGIR
jgi:membrane protein required for colicin V production